MYQNVVYQVTRNSHFSQKNSFNIVLFDMISKYIILQKKKITSFLSSICFISKKMQKTNKYNEAINNIKLNVKIDKYYKNFITVSI